jgi:endonuclease I
MLVRTLTLSGLCFCATSTFAGPYCPPADEYTAVDSAISAASPMTLGTDLREAVRIRTNIGAIRVTYQNGRYRYDESDLDLDQPGNLITIYSMRSISSTWDSGATWNREHTWPVSHQASTSSSSTWYCDFHMLRPCISSVNSSRGNKPFGQTGSNTGSSLWDPGFDPRGGINYTFDPQDRGEMARTMFYMAARFNWTLRDVFSASQLQNGQMGNLSDLLRWHFEYPADIRERYRNDKVDDAIQFNRNPFVDRNEFVWAIWGDAPNDSTITLDAGSLQADGASTMTVNIGDVIVGSDFPEIETPYSKSGQHPTTYRVYATGDAISAFTDVVQTPLANERGGFDISIELDDWKGRTLAFPYGPSSVTRTLGGITLLAAGQPGQRSGEVVIDNTDLTSAGAGRGNADGDDVITLNGREVEGAQPSLEPEFVQASAIVDLGSFQQNHGLVQTSATIYNLQRPSGFTANLRVTGFDSSGGSGVLTVAQPTDEAPGGGSLDVPVVVDTNAGTGLFQTTITLDVADADIPGGQSRGTLLLTLQGEVVPVTLPADLNNDGLVDGADFGIFAAAFGSQSSDANYSGPCDFNNDGSVDGADFGVFAASFGTGG